MRMKVRKLRKPKTVTVAYEAARKFLRVDADPRASLRVSELERERAQEIQRRVRDDEAYVSAAREHRRFEVELSKLYEMKYDKLEDLTSQQYARMCFLESEHNH